MITSLLKNLSIIFLFGACVSSSHSSKQEIADRKADNNISLQPVMDNNKVPQSLMDLPQTQDGGFVLKPGFYETEFKTYCLQPGTPDPRPGDAYLQGPITGYRKDIVESVLLNSRNKQEIDQRNIQLLLWSVVSGSDFNKLSYDVRSDAMKLLTPKQIFELRGGIVGAIKTVSYSTGILNANKGVQQLFEKGIDSYEAFEQIAVRKEQARVIKKGINYDQWYKQEGNYYVRYFPVSYKKVRIQIYVPDSLMDADGKVNGEYVVFDPTGLQAIPTFTNAQRLGIGAPVIDIVRAIIQVNKKPAAPKKILQKKNPKAAV